MHRTGILHLDVTAIRPDDPSQWGLCQAPPREGKQQPWPPPTGCQEQNPSKVMEPHMPPDVAKIPREGKTTISNARPCPKLPWKIPKSPGNLASATITWASRIIQVFVCVPKQRSSFAFPTILGAEVSQLPEDTRPAGWTARIHSRGLSDTSTCFHLREPFYPNVTTVVSETISVPIPLSLLLQGNTDII